MRHKDKVATGNPPFSPKLFGHELFRLQIRLRVSLVLKTRNACRNNGRGTYCNDFSGNKE